MNQNKFPKVNFIGNKEKLSHWITKEFPNDSESVLDLFSGGCSISYAAKKLDKVVYSNDILKINYYLAKSLIENQKVKLDEKDLDLIFSGKPFSGYMTENYSNVYYFKEECKELDLYRQNIEKIRNEFKKSLAFSLMRRAMIRKRPYSRFNVLWEKVVQLRDENYSYEKYKRKRAYHNLSFKHHFFEEVASYNNAIFDNKKRNKAYNLDAFDALKKIKADVIYLDPPYPGTMNDYHAFYGILDNFILSKEKKIANKIFTNKKKSEEEFHCLFSKIKNFKYLFLSHNNNSYPSLKIMKKILENYFYEVKIIKKDFNYQITGARNKRKNTEYLFKARIK